MHFVFLWSAERNIRQIRQICKKFLVELEFWKTSTEEVTYYHCHHVEKWIQNIASGVCESVSFSVVSISISKSKRTVLHAFENSKMQMPQIIQSGNNIVLPSGIILHNITRFRKETKFCCDLQQNIYFLVYASVHLNI